MTVNIEPQKLDGLIEKAFFYYDLPGIAIHVGDGSSSWSSVRGYQNAAPKTPLRPEHIFHIASVTKLLVGTCIMKLCAQGKTGLEESLVSCLPDFRTADPRFERVTLRQMLSHTAGIPDVTDYHWERHETDEQALKRYIYSDEIRNAPLLWDPADGKFAYSNIAYEILGHVIAELSGMPFEDHVAEAVLKPAGMKDSTLLTFTRDTDTMAAPHGKDAENHFIVLPHFPYSRPHAASSTLTAPIADLGKLADAFLSGVLLTPEQFHTMLEPQAVVPNNGEQICLSWFRREQDGLVLFGHEGADDGFRSSFWICPENGLHIAVCSNLSQAPLKKISKQILEALLR
jgi:CubicO group peptidase (beta-lactamase class C family)